MINVHRLIIYCRIPDILTMNRLITICFSHIIVCTIGIYLYISLKHHAYFLLSLKFCIETASFLLTRTSYFHNYPSIILTKYFEIPNAPTFIQYSIYLHQEAHSIGRRWIEEFRKKLSSLTVQRIRPDKYPRNIFDNLRYTEAIEINELEVDENTCKFQGFLIKALTLHKIIRKTMIWEKQIVISLFIVSISGILQWCTFIII